MLTCKSYLIRRVKRLVRHHALKRHVPRVGGEPRDALKVESALRHLDGACRGADRNIMSALADCARANATR